MSDEIHEQIYKSMDLRETEDLLEIWRTNNHEEWSEAAFEAIEEILKKRGVEIPAQDEPAEIPVKEIRDQDFTKEELEIIDDENPPVFYSPLETLNVVKQIQWSAKAMLVLIVLTNLFNSSSSYRIAQGVFIQDLDSPMVYLFTFALVIANILSSALILYIPLTALTHILKILMQMEFKSRKA